MNCPACHAAVPPPSDPTQRIVVCPACSRSIDLAADADDAASTGTVVRPTAPDPLIGKDFAGGRYHVEALLGIGGMGRVYTATQRGLGRAVALKVLSPEFAKDEQFRRRFDREAGTLASLEHPHIVTVHDVGVEGDTPYIVMSLVKGPKGVPTSLRDVLDAGPMDEEWALKIVQQTCSALEYAHGRGVIHRDIKPGNILIDAHGGAKIADFGIARVGAGGDASQLTTTGAVLGTLRYMAPEQLADSAHADARSDLYSLGVVLYEMLTGESPLGRFELPSEAKQGLDRRLDSIVDKALRRVSTQRYQSAAEMARDLSRITTEREYGRMVGGAPRDAGPAGAGGGAAAVARPSTGGGGGGTAVVAESAAGPASVAGLAALPAATPSPASVPTAAATRTKRPAWLLPVAGTALVGAIVGGALLLRGGDTPKAPAATPEKPAPDGPSPGKPASETPPARPPEAPPPAMNVPTGATDDSPAELTDDDREEIELAKKSFLTLIAFGNRISLEDFASQEDALPEVKGADLAGARNAVARSLELWKDGKFSEVADRVPDALLASIAKPRGVAASQARAALVSTEYTVRPESISTGKAIAVGVDWALVRYDVTTQGGGAVSQVAVCVREGGAWKVFL